MKPGPIHFQVRTYADLINDAERRYKDYIKAMTVGSNA
jgi:hypothetical protein